MRTLRFYVPLEYNVGDVITAPENTTRHIVQVLRLRVNDEVVLFPGDNAEYIAKILEIGKKCVSLGITQKIAKCRESNIQIHLIQAISKGDRMDWVVQKAVELGVTSILPVTSSRTNVNLSPSRLEKKRSHWQAVVASACEQCGRNLVPEVQPIAGLLDVAQRYENSVAIQKLMLNPLGENKMRVDCFSANKFVITIGPEGGFDAVEENKLLSLGFERYQMGPRILRTETAAVAAICLLQAFRGDI